ncbi:MAG TPA: flagellar basal body L-ring protein FlgH [Fervidobacterium sp.]|jgi:flagellar L-ring protein precursor FlgH|nr:flagellar basal body L-ring protein FlgH [Fervidobacterium sp.]NLH37478.1 flagellar basal body L-ring protein FlgH [Thermotogaceae bacterium]MBP8656857.1 flagellar basal body L-ring protein FlgH [Fervidobacterium sp.]MBP9518823.1 flagellar basal body L-ring protein FlgH [Fervidobacterium sp.]HOA16428.1 flagellar basal body L-ring protein FlgH [Fervidobacterium sp.]
MGKGLIRFASIVFLLISVLVLADSLYTNSKNPQFQNILGTYKPSRVGDYVTVVVYESPRISTSSQVNSLTGAFVNAINTGTKLVGLDLSKYLPTNSSDTDKRDNKSQANAVVQLTAVVKQVDETGKLFLEGKKQIKVGNDLREIIITGWVHPQSIGPDNVVNSTDLIDAQIWENGKIVFQDDPQQSSWLGLILASITGLFK